MITALIISLLTVSFSKQVPKDFVYTENNKFMLNGAPYYFAGANCYNLFTFGGGWGNISTWMNKTEIIEMFEIFSKNDVSVIRTWGFDTEEWHGFQTGPYTYQENEFIEFDFILYTAKQYNIKVIITLTNYWTDYGGITQYLEWVNEPTSNQGIFFNNSNAIQIYKNYTRHFVQRVNTYTGIPYIDDPTIFAWEVCNEPRHQGLGDDVSSVVLRSWMDEIGKFIKDMDSNHLISSGIEGQGTVYGYGGDCGNNFTVIHSSPYIDFCSAHVYPTEGWAGLNISATQNLIKQWIYDCQINIGKPFFLGEFNVQENNNVGGSRSNWWKAMYDTIETYNAGGDAFWWFTNEGEYGYNVIDGSPELQVFQQHSKNMQAKSG